MGYPSFGGTVERLMKRALMVVARAAELVKWNRLQFWAYDLIIRRGWDGYDTFIRLDDDFFDGE